MTYACTASRTISAMGRFWRSTELQQHLELRLEIDHRTLHMSMLTYIIDATPTAVSCCGTATQGDAQPFDRSGQAPFTERNGGTSPDGRWLAYESDESGQFDD